MERCLKTDMAVKRILRFGVLYTIMKANSFVIEAHDSMKKMERISIKR